MVWYEKREGHHAVVLRGDGRTLRDLLIGRLPMYLIGPAGTFHRGDRYAVISHDQLTGLIRYDHWYFEHVE